MVNKELDYTKFEAQLAEFDGCLERREHSLEQVCFWILMMLRNMDSMQKTSWQKGERSRDQITVTCHSQYNSMTLMLYGEHGQLVASIAFHIDPSGYRMLGCDVLIGSIAQVYQGMKALVEDKIESGRQETRAAIVASTGGSGPEVIFLPTVDDAGERAATAIEVVDTKGLEDRVVIQPTESTALKNLISRIADGHFGTFTFRRLHLPNCDVDQTVVAVLARDRLDIIQKNCIGAAKGQVTGQFSFEANSADGPKNFATGNFNAEQLILAIEAFLASSKLPEHEA